ncbi:hypothetical protein DFH08DRAFT_887778 [Mycena albidolilacea]|uniref:Uncharacterized protein n=1 Tax=Mycena albidolilacea TaxID=1033008 RepID=A0AAD6ZIK3_9AGAR|nr:hypothetical protein DFH08DRAFT_887778 [Mycena albidolilacea]
MDIYLRIITLALLALLHPLKALNLNISVSATGTNANIEVQVEISLPTVNPNTASMQLSVPNTWTCAFYFHICIKR